MFGTTNQLWLNNVENLEQKHNKHVWNHQQSPTSLHYIILYTTQYTTNCHNMMFRIPTTISTIVLWLCTSATASKRWWTFFTSPEIRAMAVSPRTAHGDPGMRICSSQCWDPSYPKPQRKANGISLKRSKKPERSVNWWVYWDPTRMPRDS